mmetsp:Transcript_6300/g.9271  ORF Transcript_6300/g.9271 Transcript_6300/m.9271 type:complete len:98 (-) Transcript_6300:180-473(-)
MAPSEDSTDCSIVDTVVGMGYDDEYRGWYDVNGCGVCNQYCRWVGWFGIGGDPFEQIAYESRYWACQTGTEVYNTDFRGQPWTALKCPTPAPSIVDP